MSHQDGADDQGHGEPGHVHDETWNRNMMATDDPAVEKDNAVENEEGDDEAGSAAGGVAGGLGGAALGGADLGEQAEEEAQEAGSADYVDPRRV